MFVLMYSRFAYLQQLYFRLHSVVSQNRSLLTHVLLSRTTSYFVGNSAKSLCEQSPKSLSISFVYYFWKNLSNCIRCCFECYFRVVRCFWFYLLIYIFLINRCSIRDFNKFTLINSLSKRIKNLYVILITGNGNRTINNVFIKLQLFSFFYFWFHSEIVYLLQ